MRLSRMLIRWSLPCGVVLSQGAAAQKSAGPSVVVTPTELRAAVTAWRSGLEVSVNGSGWNRSVAVTLTRAQCPPSETSPCASGSAVGVDVRFPVVAQAVELTRTRAALSEPPEGQSNARYELRLVRAQSSPLCPNGFVVPAPANASRLAINLGPPGPPLPLTCRWTALVGVPDPNDPAKVTAIWSDTVSVLLSVKR